ncbi:hypothetical protein [uncultured Deinococcus sp.]|uniref:hypothetical protein n=1 Tax=uncultured Deinococcus sp. TaxID=158789 RepID=UPI0025DB68D3|nr:hypothetical protein [uncultured Deinococcus sp.]
MSRFTYLDSAKKKGKGRKKAAKAERRARRHAPEDSARTPVPGPQDETAGLARADAPVTVYVRRETVRAVWREVKQDGGESVSELVEDLLLAWLRERTR